MARARLTITLPDDIWVGRVSRRYPEATLSVLSLMPTEHGGVVLLSLRSERAPDVVRDIEASETVPDVELQRAAEDVNEVVLRVETTEPRLLGPLREARLPIEYPVTIENGEATLTVAGARERLSAFAGALETIGLEFEVRYVRDVVDVDDLLTDSQQALLTAAVEAGYYDTPRETTLTELAEQRDIAKSTASERLHRAEGKVIKRFTEDNVPLDEAPGRTTAL